MNALFAQIKKTIFQTQFFRRVVFHRHLKRQHFRPGINFHGFNLDFNVTGRHIFVDAFTMQNFAGYTDNAFHANIVEFIEQIGRTVHNALCNAVVISQIHEAEIAQIPFTVNPTRQSHGLIHIRFPQFPAGMCSILIHKNLIRLIKKLSICRTKFPAWQVLKRAITRKSA